MVEHVGRGQQHGGWVGDILTNGLEPKIKDILLKSLSHLGERMACTSLKDAVVGGVALAWDDTGTTDQTSGQIVNDIAVQVWHDLCVVRLLIL